MISRDLVKVPTINETIDNFIDKKMDIPAYEIVNKENGKTL
jgi:hypothetical protein